MVIIKIIYSHNENELVITNCFSSYQQMEEAVQNIKSSSSPNMHAVRNIKMAVLALTGTVGGKGCPTYEIVYCTGNVRASG